MVCKFHLFLGRIILFCYLETTKMQKVSKCEHVGMVFVSALIRMDEWYITYE